MIDAEKLELQFDTFFASEGFRRLNEIIGPSPGFQNADYIQLQRRTVVELKILGKDFFINGGIIYRFAGFVPQPVRIDHRGF